MTGFISLLLVLSIFALKCNNADCAKILSVFPFPIYSQFALASRLSEELADRGHQVTAINPYPQKTPIKNYKEVSVEDLVGYFEEVKENYFAKKSVFNPFRHVNFLFEMGNDMTDRIFNHTNVQNLLKSNETYDLVILLHLVNDALIGLGHHFNCPVVILSPLGATTVNNYVLANPAPSSYIPNLFSSFTNYMNFWERSLNFLSNVAFDVMKEIDFMPHQRNLFKKYITSDLELDDVLYNVSLMLTNSHVSVNDAIPKLPNVIEIGGFHLKPPQKLPDDLQKFLDDSKEGVILFSMGSNLKSKDLKPETRDAILKAFSKIKQNVLWKFETEMITPKNLKIMKWIPQQDVLGHSNVKAFVSHGGLLSSIETIYHGKPILGIPAFGDQQNNIARAVANGYAVAVPLAELSEEKLSWALDEVLNNPKYRKNAEERSRVMHDQPLKPIDSAVYWVEHVIRHKGAPHLRTSGIDLKWYEREMVDVIGFLILIIIASSLIFFPIVKKILIREKSLVSKDKKNK